MRMILTGPQIAAAIVGVIALALWNPSSAAALPCNAQCAEIHNSSGGIIGYACVSGNAGFGCQASDWYCFRASHSRSAG